MITTPLKKKHNYFHPLESGSDTILTHPGNNITQVSGLKSYQKSLSTALKGRNLLTQGEALCVWQVKPIKP
jgi:hypothetical protein